MKRTIFKLRLLLLSVFLLSCGSHESNQQFDYDNIELKYTCKIYQGSVKIVVLSYEKDPGLFGILSKFKENPYTLSPKNTVEKDNYDYSNPSYALMVIGKGGNPFLVTDMDSIQMEDGKYITVKIERYSAIKTIPIKSVLIQD